MGVTSKELNKGGITPLNRPKKESQKSLIADIGCSSHSMFGYKLSKNLISNTRLYISIHLLASPTIITAICVPGALALLIGEENSGPGTAVVDKVLLRKERGQILEGTSMEGNRAATTRVNPVSEEEWTSLEGDKVVTVRVDPVSEEEGTSLKGDRTVTVRVDPVSEKEGTILEGESAVTVRVDPVSEEAGTSLAGERAVTDRVDRVSEEEWTSLEGKSAVTVQVDPVSEEERKSLDLGGRRGESVRILVGLGRVWKERVVRLGGKPEERG